MPSIEPINHPVDIEIANETLEILFEPTDFIEFRCLATTRNGRSGSDYIRRDFFSETEPFHDWLNAWHHPGAGIYFGPNPRKGAGGSGYQGAGTDSDVLLFRNAFVDFDDATIEQAVDRIEQAGISPPTLIIPSGRWNGCHCYWRFAEPITDPEIWKGLQRAIINRLQSDPAIKNPSRIMRLPGTQNFKQDAPCFIKIRGDRFPTWEAIGEFVVDEMVEQVYFHHDSDVPPNRENLNNITTEFLDHPCPEGNRNRILFAAAMDYKANNFPLEAAREELVKRRAVERDGLSEVEALRTVHNAYRRNPTPSVLAGSAAFPKVWEHKFYEKMLTHGKEHGMAREGEPIISMPGPKEYHLFPEGEVLTIINAIPVPEEVSSVNVEDIEPQVITADQAIETFSNVKIREVSTKQADRIYISVNDLLHGLDEKLQAWPKYAPGLGLFGYNIMENGEWELWPLSKTDALFAFMKSNLKIHWHSGECIDYQGKPISAVSRSEFFDAVKKRAISKHSGVGIDPHHPPIRGFYYLPTNIPKPDPAHPLVQEFIDNLNPDTEADRALLLAAMLTPGWGGPAGARPLFVLASDHGQGSGKTETVKAIGEIWGGATMVNVEESWEQNVKGLMSSEEWMTRIVVFDNVKGKFRGSSIESAVTSSFLRGHRMYVGTVARYNDATFFVTFNLPQMNTDLAQRAVVIKIGSPKPSNFAEWWPEFVRENREGLMAELLNILKREPVGFNPGDYNDRWRSWQRGVLARIPQNAGTEFPVLMETMIARRREVDAETADGEEMIRVILTYLKNRNEGSNPVDVPDGMSLIAKSEIVSEMVKARLWKVRHGEEMGVQDSGNCIRHVTGRLLSHGCLSAMMRGTGAKAGQKRVVVDYTGKPVSRRQGAGDTLSPAYLWNHAAALLAVGGDTTPSYRSGAENAEDMPPI